MDSTPHLFSDTSPPLRMQHSSSNGGGSDVGNGGSGVGNGGFGCIQHSVSKYDTLAGVAIKYGVEVADIKKMNGLTTDLQMFSRKSLKIPLPGRHPPSPVMSNGHDTQGQTISEITPLNRRYSDTINSIDSLKSLKLSSSSPQNISSSITSLRDYYSLTPNEVEGFEMTQTPLGHHRKTKSDTNGLSNVSKAKVGDSTNPDKSIEKLVRRRKSEVDLNNHSPDMMTSAANVGPVPAVQAFSGVRKSSSAPTFQQPEVNNSNSVSNSTPSSSSSFWPVSMLNFTLDIQAAITSPLFDGLPKPTSGRKKKPARD